VTSTIEETAMTGDEHVAHEQLETPAADDRPDRRSPGSADDAMDKADEANGEGRSEHATNDTEERYGADESPA